MNDFDIEQIRQKLLALQAEIKSLEASTRETTRPVELDQASVGRLSRMDAIQVQQMAQASGRRRQEQLLKIEGALRRIESGEFGYCFVCGEEIDPRRLSADLTITRCINCVEKQK